MLNAEWMGETEPELCRRSDILSRTDSSEKEIYKNSNRNM